VSLCKVRVATDLELMGLLSEMEAANGFRAVGYATFAEYAASVLHMPARQARDLVRVARDLPKLPGLKQAMADGRVGWTKAREIVRVASPDTVDAWVARAEQASSRELEALVAAASPGDAPPVEAPKGAAYTSRVLHRLEASDAEVIDELLAFLRASVAGDDVSDGTLLAEFARRYLRGVADGAEDVGELPALEPAVLHLQVAPDGHIEGYEAETSETIASQVACDAKIVDVDGATARTIPSRVREMVLNRDRRRCTVPGCAGRFWLHLHHVRPFVMGGGHEPANLLTLCACHHRLIHEGRLRVEVDDEGAVHVERADGTVRVGPPEPGRRPTHVGHGKRGAEASRVGRRACGHRRCGAPA
jgi:hypothetical protein